MTQAPAIADALDAVKQIQLLTAAETERIGVPAATHMLRGGRRLRSRALVAATGDPATPLDKSIENACRIVELIHLASLLHDDVADNAGKRRGVETVNAIHGDRAAVRMGSLVFSAAWGRVVRLPSVCERLCQTSIEAMYRAQADEARRIADDQVTAIEYEAIASGKTGALFGCAIGLGCLLGTSPETTEHAQQAARSGDRLGVAYQVHDDIMDWHGDTGEVPFQDAERGTLTLPLIILSEMNETARPRIKSLLNGDSDSGDLILELRDRMIHHGVLERARAAYHTMIAEAASHAALLRPHRAEMLTRFIEAFAGSLDDRFEQATTASGDSA